MDQRITGIIEGFREHLGDGIYAEILGKSGHSLQASLIPNANLQKTTLGWMQTATRGFEKVHSLCEEVGEAQFIAITDALKINAITAIPNLETLRCLVDTLEASKGEHAA